jgi:hypothetical protein
MSDGAFTLARRPLDRSGRTPEVSALKFRKAVAEEFERLFCAGAATIDLPEADD